MTLLTLPSSRAARTDKLFRSRRTLPGFTLVEVLVALAMSTVLLLAVYGSLRMYWTITTTGRIQVEQAQLARAILRRIEVDAASVMYQPPETATDTGQAADSGSTSESESGSTESGGQTTLGLGAPTTPVSGSDAAATVDPLAAASSTSGDSAMASLGIVGDSQNLMLHISRPSRSLNYAMVGTSSATAAGVDTRLSDLLSVSYFLASSSAGGLQAAVAAQSTTPGQTGSSTGLARLEGDRMAISFADAGSKENQLAAAAEIIAPEVIELQFRYFDGAVWSDVWDTTANGRLPMAIEVTMGFEARQANIDPRVARKSGTPTVGRVIRHVISVPMATPAEAVY